MSDATSDSSNMGQVYAVAVAHLSQFRAINCQPNPCLLPVSHVCLDWFGLVWCVDFANLPTKVDDAVDLTKDNSPGLLQKFRTLYMGGLKYNLNQIRFKVPRFCPEKIDMYNHFQNNSYYV